MPRYRTITAAVALLALAGGALALAQPERTAQPGQRRGDPAQFVERMMQRDANSDGKLSRDELPEQIPDRFFDEGDTNKDGALDREELLASMKRRAGQGGRQGGADAQASFEDSMHQAGRALEGLKLAELTGESMRRDLRSVQMLQQALLRAKGNVSDAPSSEHAQEKFRSDGKIHVAIRMNIARVLRESLTLEMAILEGKEGAARESLAKILEIQEKAHAVFQPEDDDD